MRAALLPPVHTVQCDQSSHDKDDIMPTHIKRLTAAGLQPVPYEADSLAEAATHEPDDGIYTVSSTRNTTDTLKLDAHFDRMEDSARRQQMPLQLDRERIRAALRTMIDEAQFGDVRFRITVARDAPDEFLLSIEPFPGVPAEIIEHGVRCITAPNSARQSAAAKTTHWMHARTALQAAQPEGIYDTFLLDADGYLLEGLGSNFYAILGGTLYSADENVLKGISQQIVFEVAPGVLPLRKEAVHVRQIPDFQEAFLTSSSRGIVPVVEIDGLPIGTGQPGPLTKRLREVYEAWVDEHLQPL